MNEESETGLSRYAHKGEVISPVALDIKVDTSKLVAALEELKERLLTLQEAHPMVHRMSPFEVVDDTEIIDQEARP